MTNTGPKIVRLAGVVLALAAIAVVAALVRAVSWERQAAQRWERIVEPIGRLVARYPKMSPNAATRRLEELAARLGLRLDSSAAELPSMPRRDEIERLLKRAGTFVSEQGNRVTDTIDAPPEDVSQFLREQHETIVAIEALLVDGDTPVWSSDLSKGLEAPFPALWGQRALHNVLLADALVATRLGDRRSAERSLEASWVLRESLVHPLLVCQLIGVAIDSLQNGVLRRIPNAPAAWQTRVKAHDYRLSFARAFEIDAYLFRETLRLRARATQGLGGLVWRSLVAVYFRLCAADYSRRLLNAVAEMQAQDACTLDVEAVQARTSAAIPHWNALGRLEMEGSLRAWGSVGPSALDAELTARILELDAERTATGRLRARPETRSHACPGVRWREEGGVDGGLTIRADRNPFARSEASAPPSFALHLTPAGQSDGVSREMSGAVPASRAVEARPR